ncbi:PAS domain-containing protein [Sediminibacterium sp.]|uniref:PAS domain-containing protein n=1 Tax=Sediminibacterium sp. TaxID=1917865 RepID=UPI0035219AB4
MLARNKVIIITDTQQRIVFASSNITVMKDYLPSEVLGQTPRMFQGEATESKTRAVIRRAMSRLRPFHVVMTNYRKNGTSYRCEINVQPVLSKTHFPTHFIAFQNIVGE